MSIVIAVKVGEGLVLAADSAASVTIPTPDGSVQIANIFNHARKLLHIKDYPIGVLTWGLAAIGPRSVESLIKEYEETKPAIYDETEANLYDAHYEYEVKAIAQEIFHSISAYCQKIYGGVPVEKQPPVGLYVGGFSRGKFFADQYAFVIPVNKEPLDVRPNLPDGSPSFGANWFGLTDAIIRFIKGYDEGIRDILAKKGLTNKDIDDLFAPLEYRVNFNGMPLQDAINFAVSMVQMTIARYSFVIGAPVCGGATDVAVITNRYFNWVQRKSWKI